MYDSHKLISDLSFRMFFSNKSYFRYYQDIFLQQYGSEFNGKVIELGAEKHYQHGRFFNSASAFVYSNVGRDYDFFLDVTKMTLEDNSQDGYLCISVLEHVRDIQAAFSEITRTLKPGGKLLLSIPFAYPYHDEVDYWRLSIDSFNYFLRDYEIKSFVHFGGLFSSIVDNLRRPRTNWKKRYFIHKIIGLMVLAMGKFLESKDGFPLGYGIYAIKK